MSDTLTKMLVDGTLSKVFNGFTELNIAPETILDLSLKYVLAEIEALHGSAALREVLQVYLDAINGAALPKPTVVVTGRA